MIALVLALVAAEPTVVEAEIVYFKTDWCGACKRFEENVLASKYVKRHRIVVRRVNPEASEEEKALADDHEVRRFPSLFLVDAKGWRRLAKWYSPRAFIDSIRAVQSPNASP